MTDPAEKYRDKVDPNHKMAMDAIAFSRQLLEPQAEHLRALLKAEQHAHAIGHITDPTMYRDMIYSKSFAQQIRLARAALAYIDELNAVAEEIGEKT